MSVDLAETAPDAARRLRLMMDGCSIAFVEFYLFREVAIVTHTEVELLHQGRGLGSVAVSRALEHFRREGWKVVPVCGFFLQHIRRHPEYSDLLAAGCRRIFAV